MKKLLLTSDEIVNLWSMQPTGPYKSWSKWILSNMWLYPLLLIIPLIMTNFDRTAITICFFAATIFLVYGFVTAKVCAPWKRRRKMWIKKSTLSTLLIQGYNAFFIIFLSLTFLAITMIVSRNLIENRYSLTITIGLLYLITSIVIFIFTPHLIRKRIYVLHNPTSKKQRIPVLLAGGGPGLGVLLSILLKGTPYFEPFMITLGTIGALLLLPFSVPILYEIIILVLNLDKAP